MGLTDTGFSTSVHVAESNLKIACADCRRTLREGDKYRTYGRGHVYAAGPSPHPHHLDCDRPQGSNRPRRDPENEQHRSRLRAYLLAGKPDTRGVITAAVCTFAAEYGCHKDAVWKWLSGARPIPGWLRRELAQPPV